MHISVTIIARDAGATLSACISSIVDISDNIIVVIDNRTSDDTANIAKSFAVKIHRRKFTDFADQHNFADLHAAHDWILSLDADETASPELIKEIKSLPEKSDHAAFWIPRKNKIFGKIINHTNWDPDGIVRLYNRGKCRWQGQVHERIQTDDPVGRLTGVIYHDNYRSVGEFISRQNVYSSQEAEQLSRQKIKFSIFKAFLYPLYDFGRRFFWHAGFLDGWHGLYLSYLMVIYHVSVWIKLWHLENSRKE